jgi:hypothetical protein
MLPFQLLRKPHPALLVVPLLLGTLFLVLFRHSLNFLLEDLPRPLPAALILVVLFRHSHQITRFLVGGQFHQGGMTQPPLSGQIPIGTLPPIGTPPSIGGPTPPYGQNIPLSLAQYWNQLIQHPPQSTGGQQFPLRLLHPLVWANHIPVRSILFGVRLLKLTSLFQDTIP